MEGKTGGEEMITVHKFNINIGGYTDIVMPEKAKYLGVKNQHGNIVLYVLLDTKKPKWNRRFLTVATGEEITDMDMKYHVGTVQLGPAEYEYVCHVFSVKCDGIDTRLQKIFYSE